ncbi:MAG TPA: TonB family protein [Terracidiphilus sp.]|nr:TonB family protein [Terracidiphilus sp.]
MRPILASTLMLSSILIPAAANASTSADDATAPTPGIRVSTGVIAPMLDKAISIELPNGLAKTFIPMDSLVGLSFTVDTKGQAQDVKVVKSMNPYWDARVVEAIQRSHFRPGKLDNQLIPVEMNVTVDIRK